MKNERKTFRHVYMYYKAQTEKTPLKDICHTIFKVSGTKLFVNPFSPDTQQQEMDQP